MQQRQVEFLCALSFLPVTLHLGGRAASVTLCRTPLMLAVTLSYQTLPAAAVVQT